MFSVRQDTGVLEVEFTGQLTPGFVRRLRTIVEATGLLERGIVLDMGRLQPDDPDALWELIAFLTELDSRGIPLHVRKINPRLRSLLSLIDAPGLSAGPGEGGENHAAQP